MLETKGNRFYNNGKKITILSGAMHYFRFHKEQYRDRLTKLKACGMNTVETYVAWNMHEPKKGEFVFEDYYSLKDFLETAKELDLMVMLRPGPYICAEWEFGGFPAWLLEDKNMKLRCYDKAYLKHVDDWFDVLIDYIRPYLASNGGPIIAVQVENEYGSYGDDKAYLNYLRDGLIRRGVTELLFTSDGPIDYMLEGGKVENVLQTVNFGSRVEEAFEKLEEHQKDKPLMCMEFWNGWFDHWGNAEHANSSKVLEEVFEDMLKRGAGVNFYMFYGGTNFRFMNGANYHEEYKPTVTSYDYGALLTEAGDITPQYRQVRALIEKYYGPVEMPIPVNSKKMAYGKLELTECAGLFENLNNLTDPVQTVCTETMESLGQDYGYILYSKRIEGKRGTNRLRILGIRDRALIYVNKKYMGTYTRMQAEQEIMITVPEEGITLDVLVENQGRVNYGPHMRDYKGITEGICLEYQFLFHYDTYTLDLKDLSQLSYVPAEIRENPTFYKGTLQVEEACDTFINLPHFKKGVVFVNGFNIGRYWEIGPTRTLYIPAQVLKQGNNEIVVFEELECSGLEVEFIEEPILG